MPRITRRAVVLVPTELIIERDIFLHVRRAQHTQMSVVQRHWTVGEIAEIMNVVLGPACVITASNQIDIMHIGIPSRPVQLSGLCALSDVA